MFYKFRKLYTSLRTAFQFEAAHDQLGRFSCHCIRSIGRASADSSMCQRGRYKVSSDYDSLDMFPVLGPIFQRDTYR